MLVQVSRWPPVDMSLDTHHTTLPGHTQADVLIIIIVIMVPIYYFFRKGLYVASNHRTI